MSEYEPESIVIEGVDREMIPLIATDVDEREVLRITPDWKIVWGEHLVTEEDRARALVATFMMVSTIVPR